MLQKIKDRPGLIVLILIGLHFLFLASFFAPAISTPDAQGYFTQAKSIAREGTTHIQPSSILQYLGPHWYPNEHKEYYATFPPGYPLLLGLILMIAGYKVAIFLDILLASLSLLLLFQLSSRIINKMAALFIVFIFIFNPVFNEHALFADSHIPVLFFLLSGLVLYYRFKDTGSSLFAFLAGFFMGCLPSVRYADSMISGGFILYVMICTFNRKHSFKQLFIIFTGFLVPIILLAIHNYFAFGSILKTAYNIPESQPVFGLDYFLLYADQYLLKLMNEGVGILFLPGIAGLVYLCILKETREIGLLAVLLIIPVTLLYMSYCWPTDPQSMRFLLPTLPFYLITGVIFLRTLIPEKRLIRNTILIIIITVTIVTGPPGTIKRLQYLKLNNQILAGITKSVEENIKPGSIIIAPEGINQHLDFVGKWKLADPNILHTSLDPSVTVPIAAIPSYLRCRNTEANLKYVKFRSFLGKNVHHVFAYDLWNWAGDSSDVYIIGYDQQIDYFRRNIPSYYRITEEVRIELLPYLTTDTTQIVNPRPFTFPRFRNTAIYDFYVNGQPLFIAKWTKEGKNARGGGR